MPWLIIDLIVSFKCSLKLNLLEDGLRLIAILFSYASNASIERLDFKADDEFLSGENSVIKLRAPRVNNYC